MNATTSGAAAEYMAAVHLSSLGYVVLWPMDPGSAYDLLIERKGEFLKVQVKRAYWHKAHSTDKNDHLKVCVTTRPKVGVRQSYAYGAFDLLAAIDETRMWLVPYEECRARKVLSLDKRGTGVSRRRLKQYDPSRWLVK